MRQRAASILQYQHQTLCDYTYTFVVYVLYILSTLLTLSTKSVPNFLYCDFLQEDVFAHLGHYIHTHPVVTQCMLFRVTSTTACRSGGGPLLCSTSSRSCPQTQAGERPFTGEPFSITYNVMRNVRICTIFGGMQNTRIIARSTNPRFAQKYPRMA